MVSSKEFVLDIEEAKQVWPKCDINKAKDLTNMRFGKLVCLYRTDNIKNLTVWVCKCDCGKIKPIRAGELTQSKKPQRSCGCAAAKRAKNFGQVTARDITNQVFGRLTAIKKVSINQYGYAIWECQCECGNKCEVTTRELLSGDTQSCGCLYHEKKSYWEIYIANYLNNLNINYKQEYKFNNLKDKFQLRFDFAIFKNDILKGLIEYQGEQHYNKINPFYNPDIVRHDQMKKDYCQKNNIPLLEIKYTETKQIEEKIKEFIKQIGG